MPFVELSTVALLVSVLIGSKPAVMVAVVGWFLVNIGLRL